MEAIWIVAPRKGRLERDEAREREVGDGYDCLGIELLVLGVVCFGGCDWNRRPVLNVT
jgi:hypothetical protein